MLPYKKLAQEIGQVAAEHPGKQGKVMNRMKKNWLPITALTAAFCVCSSVAQETHYAPVGPQIPPPNCLVYRAAWAGGSNNDICRPDDYAQWLKDIEHWRAERRIRVGLGVISETGLPDVYNIPSLQWTRSEFIQPQMMVNDRYFYDPEKHKYTVDRYLADLEARYGGIDAVLIWATYPNMGIDDRNQLDMVKSMPGGVAGVRQMVDDFHRHGVKVLFPMMLWDEGTRDPGTSWPQSVAALMKDIDADGVNGDTQDGVPLAFTLASLKDGKPLAFQPEHGSSDEALAWNVLTWGQYQFQFVPTVDRFRWLQPLHMVNISDRWNRDKTNDLQFAFFNGEGWESWENIWGIWNGITPFDGEATRRVATLERAMAPFFANQDWQPFYPMHLYGVFASRWPLHEQTLWTIVNRNEYDVSGNEMTVPDERGMRYFDLYHGVELTPEHEGKDLVLSFSIEAHGYGAVLATAGDPGANITQLMSAMKDMTAKPLSSYFHDWIPLTQHLVEIPPTTPATTVPRGMIRIEGGDYLFRVKGIEIEGSENAGVDVQYPWENSPRRDHEHQMRIKPYYINEYPVTNSEFKTFLEATHYHPADDLNFLKDWKDGTYPEGWGNKPVTWVSIEDARSYAKWAGKRLPHEWEWQYAAQGRDQRRFPWGNCDWLAPTNSGGPFNCPWENTPQKVPAPVPDKGRVMEPASNVESHPAGASPFGVMDMVGNVWQWTDEYVDNHTRAAILRGGSHYQPQGSFWYFPQAYANDQHGKLLLMAPSYDRSRAIGFRCVKDAE